MIPWEHAKNICLLNASSRGTIFANRWLLARFDLRLAVSLLVLLIKFIQKKVALVFSMFLSNDGDIVTAVLSLVPGIIGLWLGSGLQRQLCYYFALTLRRQGGIQWERWIAAER